MESLRKCHLYPLFLSNALICIVYLQSALAGDCPADGRTWVPFGQRCYHFVHGEEDIIKTYTFEDAQDTCSGYGLVSIQSAEENEFVINYSHEVWKGNVNMWLGMYYDTDSEEMRWTDETAVSFKNWGQSSFLADLMPMDTCVALYINTGKWENVSCAEEVEHGVVCESAEKAAEGKSRASPLLSAMVILSVVGIMGISATIWFLQQRRHVGSAVLSTFEYHPPFRTPPSDEACLVEAEEVDDMP